MTLANRLKSKINLCLLCKQIEHFYFYDLNTYLKRTRQDQSNDEVQQCSTALRSMPRCRVCRDTARGISRHAKIVPRYSTDIIQGASRSELASARRVRLP